MAKNELGKISPENMDIIIAAMVAEMGMKKKKAKKAIKAAMDDNDVKFLKKVSKAMLAHQGTDDEEDIKIKGHDTTTSETIMAQADIIKAIDAALADATPAAVVRLIEGVIKADTTPAGEYAFISPTGHQVIVTKSGGIGKKTWQLDGEKVSRSEAYNTIKDAKIKKAAATDTDQVDGPPNKQLKASYKKKQIVNVLKAGQFFSKDIIKAIKQDITEKTITGGTLVTILDDQAGEEVATDRLVSIFNALND